MLLQSLVHHVPIHDLPKSGKMVGATVLIVKIIGVFPHVEGQQGPQAVLHGIARVVFLRDDEFAVCIGGQPHPARSEQGGAFFGKLFLEGIKATELLVNPLRNHACGFVVGFWGTELGEVKVVVEDLTGIVEHATIGSLHDFLKRHFGVLRAFDEAVEVVYVCIQMFTVVKTKSFLADDGFERVGLVRQLDQFVFFHDDGFK